MKRIVLDTNSLLMYIPKNSPYRIVWDAFLNGEFILCLSNEIVEEYLEILSNKTTASIAGNVISTILNQHNIELINPYYRFGLIQTDADDNKFVDCAIATNARYIVTEDKHFDVLRTVSFPVVYIINIDGFCKYYPRYIRFCM